MARNSKTKKNARYRKKQRRADYRAGGRVSLQAGGAGNINVPNVDVQLTPEQLEAMRLANEATTTTPTAGPETVTPTPVTSPTVSQSRRPPNPREGDTYTDAEGVRWIFTEGRWEELGDTAPPPPPPPPPPSPDEVTPDQPTSPPDNPSLGDTCTDANGTIWIYTEKGWLDINNIPVPPPPPPPPPPPSDQPTVGDIDPANGFTWNGTEWVRPEGTEGQTWDVDSQTWITPDPDRTIGEIDPTTGLEWDGTTWIQPEGTEGQIWDAENQKWVDPAPQPTVGDIRETDGFEWNGTEWVRPEGTGDLYWDITTQTWVLPGEGSSWFLEWKKKNEAAKQAILDKLPVGTTIADPEKVGGYQRNADGSLKLDKDNNPIPIVPDVEGSEIEKDELVKVGWERNQDGSLKLDEEGNPIKIQAAQVGAETVETITEGEVEQVKNVLPGGYTFTPPEGVFFPQVMPAEGMRWAYGPEGDRIQVPAGTRAGVVAQTYSADEVEENIDLDHATGTVSPDSLAKTTNVDHVGKIDAADVEIPPGALVGELTGELSDDAKATAAKIVGTSLPRITRAKKQLRNAGLSEDEIAAIGNDPDDLEARLMDFTEEQRGLIAGLPEDALVSTQLSALLDGIEEGEIPVWARPAVAAVEQMLAERGLSASTVGRDNLLNAIIQSATPIAQSNAQAIQASIAQQKDIEARIAIKEGEFRQEAAMQTAQAVFNMDMANFDAEVQRQLSNSKFMQTVGLTEATFEQESYVKSATLLSQENLAQADIDQRRMIQHAQAFLGMDMANLSNEQASKVLEFTQEQERVISNQASVNAAAQFNATSQSQTDQFMANMEKEVAQFNTTQLNAMKQFNATQENAAEAREAEREADINKYNAELTAQMQELNAAQEFQRVQWNAANQFAVNQSNVSWRRQINTANTAAQNAVNMQNAMNSFNMTMTEQAQMWQELRDQADYDFRAYENEQNRIAQLVATAIASDPDKYSYLSGNITTLINKLIIGGD